jgi:hypothetical protein
MPCHPFILVGAFINAMPPIHSGQRIRCAVLSFLAGAFDHRAAVSFWPAHSIAAPPFQILAGAFDCRVALSFVASAFDRHAALDSFGQRFSWLFDCCMPRHQHCPIWQEKFHYWMPCHNIYPFGQRNLLLDATPLPIIPFGRHIIFVTDFGWHNYWMPCRPLWVWLAQLIIEWHAALSDFDRHNWLLNATFAHYFIWLAPLIYGVPHLFLPIIPLARAIYWMPHPYYFCQLFHWPVQFIECHTPIILLGQRNSLLNAVPPPLSYLAGTIYWMPPPYAQPYFQQDYEFSLIFMTTTNSSANTLLS